MVTEVEIYKRKQESKKEKKHASTNNATKNDNGVFFLFILFLFSFLDSHLQNVMERKQVCGTHRRK